MRNLIRKLRLLIAKKYIIEAWEAGNENDILTNPYHSGTEYWEKLRIPIKYVKIGCCKPPEKYW